MRSAPIFLVDLLAFKLENASEGSGPDVNIEGIFLGVELICSFVEIEAVEELDGELVEGIEEGTSTVDLDNELLVVGVGSTRALVLRQSKSIWWFMRKSNTDFLQRGH
jgi:hypothetical protein